MESRQGGESRWGKKGFQSKRELKKRRQTQLMCKRFISHHHSTGAEAFLKERRANGPGWRSEGFLRFLKCLWTGALELRDK